MGTVSARAPGPAAVALVLAAVTVLSAACQSTSQTGDAGAGSGGGGASTSPDGGPGASTSAASSASGPTSDTSGPFTSVAPGMKVGVESLEVLGVSRFYILAAPVNVPAGTHLPLVIVLHGDGGTGPQMRDAFPLDTVSGQGAIVAYPTGTPGPSAWDLYTPTSQNADMQFLTSLVPALAASYAIDTTRVFATGFSSGAFMVNQLACRNPSLFRAIASQSGGSPSEPNDPSASHWPNGYTRCAAQTLGNGPATLVIHGTADTTVSYDSGTFTAVYWAFIDGCGTTQSVDATDCARFDGCPSSTPVVFCSVSGLGHAIWSQALTTVWSSFAAL